MNILWVKDNNIGHEKQVKNLLDEISKKIVLNIDERLVKGFFPFFTYLENVDEKKYDLIIGAGHKTYSLILNLKKNQKSDTKSIATALVSQYGDDAQTVAMLRAAEFAAELNNDEWAKWEKVIIEIEGLDNQSILDG